MEINDIKRDFFQAAVLVYGSSSWTLTKKLEAKLDGTYARMLRAVLNISWKEHPMEQRLYGKITPIARHFLSSKQEHISETLPWSPQNGHTSIGLHARTLTEQLCDDIGCLPEDLPNLMQDRNRRGERVKYIGASST